MEQRLERKNRAGISHAYCSGQSSSLQSHVRLYVTASRVAEKWFAEGCLVDERNVKGL
jgi:hypothetical protein